MNDFINYYELLGVKSDAKEDEIRKKYKEQIKKWHPDINKDSNSIEITKKLNEAKNVLLDNNKRKEYDNYLNNIYVNGYKNIKEKVYNNNYDNNKMYTKWEYFKEYIKYSNINKYRKVFNIILVILESLFVGILQIINIIFAYIFAFISDFIKNNIDMVSVLIIIFLILLLSNNNITNINIYLSIISIIILLFIFVFIPDIIIRLLINDIPKLLSKLNIYLFKLSVGYKE